MLMSHCHLWWGPGWWHPVPAVLGVALPWCVLCCRRPGRGDQEVLGPLHAQLGGDTVTRLLGTGWVTRGPQGSWAGAGEPARPLPAALTGFFLGLWLHCEPLNLRCPSAAARGQAAGRALGGALAWAGVPCSPFSVSSLLLACLTLLWSLRAGKRSRDAARSSNPCPRRRLGQDVGPGWDGSIGAAVACWDPASVAPEATLGPQGTRGCPSAPWQEGGLVSRSQH